MKFYNYLLVLLLSTFMACSTNSEPILTENINIVPKPSKVETGVGYFSIDKSTTVSVESDDIARVADLFFSKFSLVSGWQPSITVGEAGDISLISDATIADEGYSLEVTVDNIVIKASSKGGFLYALQTLKQLLPVEFSSIEAGTTEEWKVPSVTVTDAPAFAWRGYMLDVSRHFFDKDQVKQVLDMMVELKLNRFHWHLADDQGWRVEIKKYPKLTEVGAWRVDYNNVDETLSDWWGRPFQKEGDKATYGGFYTQDEIREIVAYAKQRNIEILPEIDMPGHAQATVAAYPEIGCVDMVPYVATGGVFHNNTYNPGKEETYIFAKDVLGEIMELFPFEYIHIGGDECNKDQWKKDPYVKSFMKRKNLKDTHEVQSYFLKDIEKFINSKGRVMIGWDEILEGGLAPNATVMSWRGTKGGIQSVKMGHDVVMTPNSFCYLDLKQGHDDLEPNLGYGNSFLKASYNYELTPSDVFTEEQAKHVLGIQGNLWTESISDWGKLTYMTFPRLFAIAENGWTKESDQEWGNFIDRLYPQLDRLDAQNIRYAKSAFNVWIDHKGDIEKGEIVISLKTEADGLTIRYTTDGSEPTATSDIYTAPFAIKGEGVVRAIAFRGESIVGVISSLKFPTHKAFGAEVKVLKGGKKIGDVVPELTDLNYARLNNGDKNWITSNGDTEYSIKFKSSCVVESISFNTLRHTIRGTYPPKRVEVWGVDKSGKSVKLAEGEYSDLVSQQGRNKIPFDMKFNSIELSSVTVKLFTNSPIPTGHHQAGTVSNLKVDEFVVR